MMRWVIAGALLLLANSVYLACDASPTVFYMGNVLLHLVLGLGVAAGALLLLRRNSELRARLGSGPPVLLGLGAVAALALIVAGNTLANAWLLWIHIGLSVAGVFWAAERLTAGSPRIRASLRGALAVGILLPVGLGLYRAADENGWIRNPAQTPLSMEEEGAGPESPFWPSSARTKDGGLIPSSYFMNSELCAECHRDIYEQWYESAHHFASFNNQFYRKAIEHMQEVTGETQSSRWCAGCHDHAVLFSGKWDTPIKEQIDTPEAHTGLGCVSCHSIIHVNSTMGNGDFTLEYPAIDRLAASPNPLMRRLGMFLTRVDAEPHRKTFLKPFMRTSEFCSACHKVHLDKPVNDYRWLRGFNSYDNWQASGVSGQGARSFYYPEKPLICADCHMPLVPGKDPAAPGGLVRSHRFPAANTALPHVNGHERQQRVTQAFLKSGFITVDIFAASPVEEGGVQMMRRAGEGQEAMTTFAVGEEAEQRRHVVIREVGEVAAPLNRAGTLFQPGETVRIDVVVRTRRIGHFFPTGTVDAFDVWLELKGEDAAGRPVFWSGGMDEDGEIDPGAHFYRSFMLDGAGNQIDKRNAWQARSILYVRLIPPGAADVVHYRMKIPEDAEGPIRLTARLNHRKFTRYYTQWAYAGKPAVAAGEARAANGAAGVGSGPGDGALLTRAFDLRPWSFDPANIPPNVSGAIKDRIPELPVTVLAEDTVELRLAPPGVETEWRQVVLREDWERWNDWGIGMLLQGDLKGAEYAFKKAVEADPDHPDGWLNVARALIQEGEVDAAKPYVAKALELGPELARVWFFKAMAEKAEGDYDAALASLAQVRRWFPRDRVALNQIGRIKFLMRDYQGAVEALREVLAIDPEDLQAHYTLMLAYRGLGDKEAAARHQKLFLRFKADESAQRLTARLRRQSPEDNNERQPIHEHVSIELR